MERVCSVLLEKLDKSGERVCQRLKMLSRRPARSVSSWGKLWDPPFRSGRRRQGSGGGRMRKMEADAGILHPFLTFPISEPPHGCLSFSLRDRSREKL
ncbi:hypothetical protein F7725_019338 [Dissostichus mawsoni]|uniref:Uncharacterized protein n=1 Tax=Dissostichus mawsoni TaxID=36200 RepID=A0A7J5YLJ2_DISMA|nr:hypothetical protein F7725_019338 [Dissostichus mawsoni]